MSSGADGSEPSPGLDPRPVPEPDREPPVAPAPAPQQEVVALQTEAPAVTIVISRPGEEVQVQAPDAKGVSPAPSPPAGDGKAAAASVSLTAVAAAKEAELARSDSFDDYEQCRVCQQKTEEPLIDLGCRCRGDLAKAHRTCIDVWFRTRGSNKCEICQQVAVNIPHPETQASGWFSPLWVAFAILIGGLLLDVLISVSLGVSALPVNIIIGVLIVLGLGTALRLALECCQEWGSRRNMGNMSRLENIPPTGYHPAVPDELGQVYQSPIPFQHGPANNHDGPCPSHSVRIPTTPTTDSAVETVDEEGQSRVSPPSAAVTAMISILAQERLLGFALGSVSMGGFVLHQRRAIYRSLAEADGSPYSYQPGGITGRRSSTELAHVWNKAVDETLGRLVVYLSSRGW
ncbi:hypothetical protein U9M48_009502 [Paspalum notatum var. saurae]|uniref:RING-CH-type domain-containing protein n=1 Tax=Paspalum notatum var. saurae TaxID=547442 RepID=A0AAQ3SSN4_PASNO